MSESNESSEIINAVVLHHPGKLFYMHRYAGFFFHAVHSTTRSRQKTPFVSCVKRSLKVETLSTETVES
jgi:hypothetical protein